VARRRRSRWHRHSRRRLGPCSGPALPRRERLLPSLRRLVRLLRSTAIPSSGALAAARRPTCSSSARRSGGATSPLLSRHTHRRRKKRKPQWGWWLGHLGFRPLLDLYHGGARSDTKAPSCPRFDLPGGRVGTRLRRAGQASGERGTGQMGKIPLRLVPTPALVATRRSGQPGGRPSHQARTCGRGRVSTRRAAGRKKVRGITDKGAVADKMAPPVSERKAER
jgi:hypothetical protein